MRVSLLCSGNDRFGATNLRVPVRLTQRKYDRHAATHVSAAMFVPKLTLKRVVTAVRPSNVEILNAFAVMTVHAITDAQGEL